VKIKVCFGILLFLISCQKKKLKNEDDVLNFLKSNISNLKDHNEALTSDFNQKIFNPKLASKVAEVLPIRNNLDSLTSKIEAIVTSKKDNLIKWEEINLISLRTNEELLKLPSYNSVGKKLFEQFHNKIPTKSSISEIETLLFKNKILSFRNNVFKYIISLFNLHGQQCSQYNIIANINKSVFKKGETIVFQGAVVDLGNAISVDAKIEGQNVKHTLDGVIDYQEKISKPKGKYNLPIEFKFIDPGTGLLKQVSKKIEYEVVE
jgi:hypothetical protein